MIWKDIKGYEGLYQVSDKGEVRNKSNKILKPFDNGNGYKKIMLFKDNKRTPYYIHRLVAENFISNPNNWKQINHKDENPSNNTLENLEWCNNTYNVNYGGHNERMINSKSKTVYQYDLDGNYITYFKNCGEASIYTGVSKSQINKCCSGKLKMANGFIWKYS